LRERERERERKRERGRPSLFFTVRQNGFAEISKNLAGHRSEINFVGIADLKIIR